MRRCHDLAEQSRKTGDAAVGAVIVRDNAMVAEATERVCATMDIAGHAEILVIRYACRALETFDLTGCTLYTSVEPCWMCSYAIRDARLSKVVIGATVPSIGGVTSRYPILSDPNVDGWGDPPIIVWLRPH